MDAESPQPTPKLSRGRRMLNYFLLGFLPVLVYMIGCQTDRIAWSLLFHPPKHPKGYWESQPASCEDVRFVNARNETLHGWYFPFDGTAKAVILYCHGNAENVSFLGGVAGELRQRLQSSILVFDYAGYGKSEGSPSASGILEDGRAARRWLAERNGIPESEIVVYGQSLGGAVAVDLAAKDEARAMIVESSFTSLGDMGRLMFPLLPVNGLLKENLASIKKIGHFYGPVFISHGKADSVVPFGQGKRLFKAANEPKTFYVPISGVDYHSAPLSSEHLEKLREFIEELVDGTTAQ